MRQRRSVVVCSNNRFGLSSMADIDKLCRVCGKKWLTRGHRMDTFIHCMSLEEMLSYCTKTEIKPNDGAPYALCSKCRNHLVIAYKLITLFYDTAERWGGSNTLRKLALAVEKADVLSVQNACCFSDSEQSECSNKDPFGTNDLQKDIENTLQWSSPTENEDSLFSSTAFVQQDAMATTVNGNKQLVNLSTKQFECITCCEKFNNAKLLKEHRAVCAWSDGSTLRWIDQRPKCCGCYAEFDTRELLQAHSICAHKPNGDISSDALDASRKQFTCDICYRRYKTRRILVCHKERPYRTKQYQCARCGKAFRDKCSLDDHERVHEDERPFVCAVCAKTFAIKDSYRKHLRMHTVESDRFKCDVCGKGCRTKGNLKDHHLTHTITDRPLHQCPRCTSQFARKSCLKSHMRLHTGEKPYKCELCEARYTFSSDLRRHVMAHKGIKPFVCDICSKAYPRKDYLAKHVASSHSLTDGSEAGPEQRENNSNIKPPLPDEMYEIPHIQ